MIIRTDKKQTRFSVIDNTGLNDARLSYKAKGLLAYFLTKPDSWQVRMEDLLKHGKDGLDAIKAGMKELRENGYATLETGRDKNGHLLGKEWVIHESPIVGKPLSRSTDSGVSRRSGKPDNRENPIIGKIPPLVNTDSGVNTDPVVGTETSASTENSDLQNEEKTKKAPPVPARPPAVLFSKSLWAQNAEAFVGEIQKRFSDVPADADFAYYYQRCADWSESKSAVNNDWPRVAAKFILDDQRRGELHTHQSKPSSHDNNTATRPAAGATKPLLDQQRIIERAASIVDRISRRQNRS